jgi:hypothetical protein
MASKTKPKAAKRPSRAINERRAQLIFCTPAPDPLYLPGNGVTRLK